MKFLNQQLTLTIALILTYKTFVLGEGEQHWSRQISANLPENSNDWVPIRNGKSISFGEDLTPEAQQQYQFFTEPSNNRFNLQQQHPSHLSAPPTDVNSFSSQNTPAFQFFNSQPPKQRTVQTFGGSVGNKPIAEPLVQNPPPFQYMQEIQRGPHVHHYQSQPIPKNLQNFPQPQQQFQKLPPPPFQPVPTPPRFQPLQGEQQPQSEENVQLLYVPFDSLYQNQQQQQNQPQQPASRFNILNQPVSASLINDFYSQNEVQEIQTTKRPTIAPATSSYATTPFESNTKPKPHQPPLSMFVAIDKFKGKATELDVLHTLKNSNRIDVMDQISKNSPKVFIGPSGMDAPTGYTKFDLPYLSSIEGTRHERRIEQLPFFVAPLSYKTPPGFSKIPLPAPHVGSVVVNQPANSIDNNESKGFTQDNYYTKQPQTNLASSSRTQKVTLTSGFNYSPNGNVQLIRNEFSFPTLSPTPLPVEGSRTVYTTPRSTFAQTASQSTAETPLTKVAYKQIEEKRNYGHSTHNPATTRSPVTKTKTDYFPTSARSTPTRPQTTKTSYVELDEHKTVNEEYFGISKEKKPTFSFKFGTEVDKPSNNFNFRPIPDFNLEDDFLTTKKPRTKATTQFNFSPSTPLPTPSFEYSSTVSAIENTESFGNVNGGSDGNFFEFRSSPRPVTQDLSYNRFNFGNEQTYNSYTPQQYTQEISEDAKEKTVTIDSTTETPNFSLPSELPAISPQLPGWINSLMDDKWMQTPNITEEEVTTTTTTTTSEPPRRLINRGSRRPIASSNRPAATESTFERQPVTRRSRPTTAYTPRNSVSTTESSFTPRSTLSRGTKVRYNATSDDRGKFRTRSRTPVKKEEQNIAYQRDVLNQNYPSSIRPLANIEPTEKSIIGEIQQHQSETPNAEHIINDYNAPLESVEVIPLNGNDDSEIAHITSNQPLNYENIIETTTKTTLILPSNHKYSNNFSGTQETKPVPHHKTVAHRLKGNFNNKHRNIDSFYNTNSQDSSTHSSEQGDDENLITVATAETSTVKLTSAAETSSTEASIPRRTNFPRRRLAYTTTESTSSDADSTEPSRGSTRGRKENAVVVKKVRGRVRQTTTTEAPGTTRQTVAVRTRASYNSNRNTNRESTRDSTRGSDSNEEIKPRFRIRENTPRFRLETQESQWSARFNQNSFQPVEEKSKSLRNSEVDDEQEIVTANPDSEKDIYLVNVSASVLPTKPAEQSESIDESINMVTTTTEKDIVLGKRLKNEEELGSSFEKFVKDVLEDIESEDSKSSKVEKKSSGSEKKNGARRGIWKRVKVQKDALEAAETQNIGKQIYNSVRDNEKLEGDKRNDEMTTIKNIEIKPTEITTTEIPLEHVFSETTTVEPEIDEPKGMFDEARKALTALFSSEEDSEDVVNIEDAEDKSETIRDSTTTTEIPTTEESTTLIPTVEISTQKSIESIVKKSSKQVKTSTRQKVTGEICFRGRCVKTDEKK